jgi:hypothetical protein
MDINDITLNMEIPSIKYMTYYNNDIHSDIWKIMSEEEKNNYIKTKRIIKNFNIIILSNNLDIGDDLFLNKNKLYYFLDCNLIKERDFYECLNECGVEYEICEKDNIIKGISIKENI